MATATVFRYRLSVSYPFGKEKMNINPLRLMLAMRYFLLPRNLILKETEFYLDLTTNQQKQQLCE
jgi:hypothetical protein